MSVQEVFTSYVAPTIGNILAAVLMLSPLPAVLRVKKIEHLEHMNVLPFPGTLCVGMAFVGYGLVLPDPWLVPASLIGACAGLWFSLSVIPFMTRKAQEYMMAFILGVLFVYSLYASISVFAVSDSTQKQMWGLLSVVNLFSYYSLPLSSLGIVIKTRNSASIYLPLAICQILNCTAWAVYGYLGLNDLYVWMPQLVGAVLGIIQVVVRFVIPAKAYVHETSAAPTDTDSENTDGSPQPQDKPPIRLETVNSRTALRVVVQPDS